MHSRRCLTAILILFAAGCPSCKNNRSQDALPAQQEKKERAGREEPGEDQALPRLVVKDGTDRDLGKIREGIITSVVFTLFNEGEADATNISVHDLSQGGCTAVSQVSRLARGDSARLEFLFETLGYGGRKETRQIKVRYDHPGLSPITLSVTAEILPAEAHQVPIGELYYNFFVLVDIRDETDFQAGHIAGAIHVPKEEVMSWASALPRDFMIYLYSEDGAESDTLAKKMQSSGYNEAFSIIGGISEWKRMYGERVIIQGAR
jgi:rhodanese-related sulfurtransferase